MQGVNVAAIGRLSSDATFQFTSGGSAVMSFSMAVPNGGKGADADEVQWLRVSVWGEVAETLHNGGRMLKGCEVYVEGKLKLASWQGQDGAERHGLNVSAWACTPLGAGRRQSPQHTGGNPAGASAGPTPQRGQRRPRGNYGGVTTAQGTRWPQEDHSGLPF